MQEIRGIEKMTLVTIQTMEKNEVLSPGSRVLANSTAGGQESKHQVRNSGTGETGGSKHSI